MRVLAALLAVALPASASAAAFDRAQLDALFDGALITLPPPGPLVRARASAPLSKEDRAEVLAALAAARRASAAWPGYDALEKPLLIVRPGGRSILIGHPNPPADFAPQTVAGRVVYVSDIPRDPGFSFKVGYPFAGKPTTVITVGGVHGGTQGDAALLVHERFHEYQNERWTQRPFGEYALEEPEDVALAGLEQLALARALEAGPNDWRQPAREFLAIRRLRRARHPDIAANEDWQECTEGTAWYLERAAVPGSHEAGQPLPAQLRRPLSLDMMEKNRYYATGAGQGRLLDRLSAGWQSQVEAGASLYQLLSRAVAAPDAVADRLAADAQASPEYAALLARARADVAALAQARTQALARFNAQPGARLTIADSTRAGSYISFKTVYRLPAGGELFDPAQSYLIDAAGWLVKVQGLPMRTTAQGDAVVASDLRAVIVDGLPWNGAQGRRAFKTLRLSSPGVELQLQGGTLEYDGRTLTVSR